MTSPKLVPVLPPGIAGKATTSRDRKAEHIQLALDSSLQPQRSYFDDYRFEHRALPELDYDAIDLSCSFLGRPLAAPLLISCMTGGTPEARLAATTEPALVPT